MGGNRALLELLAQLELDLLEQLPALLRVQHLLCFWLVPSREAHPGKAVARLLQQLEPEALQIATLAEPQM
jgi:hypothetical protein